MRQCGTCNACCTFMGVPEIDKQSFAKCKNVSDKPNTTRCCTIYNERPESCSVFKCAWLYGLGSSRDRPDRSGLFVHFSNTSGRDQAQVYRVGSTWSERAQRMIDRIAEVAVVIFISEGHRSIIGGPRADVEYLARRISEAQETP